MITGYGINCEREMQHAYELAGAETKIVHLKDILLGKLNIHDYHIINFPGGFSFGDDLGAGKGLAQRIKHAKIQNGKSMTVNNENVKDQTVKDQNEKDQVVKLIDELQKFIKDEKYIFGVCNGFQVMLKLGLVPALNDNYTKQSVSLWLNDSGRFEDRWVNLKVPETMQKTSPFLRGIEKIYLPIRHGEGKIIYDIDSKTESQIKKHIAAQYCDETGKITSEYPLNPNNSFDSIAALSDSTGRVLGMMPHPEAHIYFYHNPQWTRIKKNNQSPYGEGLKIFKNIVKHNAEFILSCGSLAKP